MTEETKNDEILEEKTECDKIENEVIKDTNAGSINPEDTLEAYKALFEKQKAELDNQLKVNDSLQKQINILMRNGASVTETKETEIQNVSCETIEQQEEYISLAELGKELGKRDYQSHNLEKEK